jgi:VanZ family protein
MPYCHCCDALNGENWLLRCDRPAGDHRPRPAAQLAAPTSLGWQIDHFVGYFVITLGFCLVWRRPAVVAGALAVFAAVLEAAQGLTADRSRNIMAVVYGVGGVLTAATIAELVMRAQRRGSSADIKGS